MSSRETVENSGSRTLAGIKLAPRQLEVFFHRLRGLGYEETASQMGIARKTVNKTWEVISDKIDRAGTDTEPVRVLAMMAIDAVVSGNVRYPNLPQSICFTEREAQVAAYTFREGANAGVIAAALFLAKKTVELHKGGMDKKLGIADGPRSKQLERVGRITQVLLGHLDSVSVPSVR